MWFDFRKKLVVGVWLKINIENLKDWCYVMSELDFLLMLYWDVCVIYVIFFIGYFVLSKNSFFFYNGEVWKCIVFGLIVGLVLFYFN